ncbi:AAA family ATPase [Modestobacter sp. VKM Ac-2979]|nr:MULTISPECIES: AAA family ATPase [unclassified Modestobacter]MCZ2810115.1 AAA family ATPase [Modestobacter sp. VKM Ac-2979]MCZ2841601.1 AAA family ATPase [Modestobacter sp. VKM Ac-2980]
MRIAQLKVANHSRLIDAQLAIRQHMVLVGPNDVGKSSLLRVLELTLGATTAQLYAQLDASDFRDEAKPLVVEATLAALTESEWAYFPDEINVDATTGEKTLVVKLEASLDSTQTLEVRRTALDHAGARQLSRVQLDAIGWRSIGATSGGDRDFRQNRRSALDDVLASVDLDAERETFDGLQAQIQGAVDSSKALGDLRAKLAGQFSRAFPESLAKDDLAFKTASADSGDPLAGLSMQVTRAGMPRNITEQSDGARALFAVALYDLVTEAANLVAIDEPEMHLHPNSQRSLARLLKATGNQKLLATHSSDIVGSFDPECIISVRQGGRLIQPAAGFLSNSEKLVAQWWVRDKLEPLTASRVIAVEGVSDRLLLERAAELTGRELDRLGVSIVETDGAGGVVALTRLFGKSGFDVPMSVLVDEDAEEATASALGLSVAQLPANSVFVSRIDLEAEYVTALGGSAVEEALRASGLFSTNELGNLAKTGPGGTSNDQDVAAFCRKKKSGYKVRAAIAVAAALDASTARRIASLDHLLAAVSAP